MNYTFTACACEAMEGGGGGRGGMTNSGQLKPLGLNTIVVAERGHYWKWLFHCGHPCWIGFFFHFLPGREWFPSASCPHILTQTYTLKWKGIFNNPWEWSSCQQTTELSESRCSMWLNLRLRCCSKCWCSKISMHKYILWSLWGALLKTLL